MELKFQLFRSSDDHYFFRLKSYTSEIVLSSEQYVSKAGCANGIEAVKKNSEDDFKFNKKESRNRKYYFNLIASNGQIIGTSQMYFSESKREQAINLIKRFARNAITEDLTN